MGQPAARIGDLHVCPMVTVLVPHVGGPVAVGVPNVLIGGQPAAHIGSICVCVGPPDVVTKGSSGVYIGGTPAARMGDMTAHGGVIVQGLPTVLIGEVGGGGAKPGPPGALMQFLNEAIETARDAKEAVEKLLGLGPYVSGLGPEVDAIINKSPTLLANMAKLKGKVTVEYGPAGGGTYYDANDPAGPKIVIDESDKGNPAAVAQSLAHESGHALYKADPEVPMEGKTRDEYVDGNTNRHLKDEGEATLTNAQVHDEILANGGPDIGVAGAQEEKYKEIAKKYPDPADRDKARQEIADIFADGETPSGDENKDKTYRDYYSQYYKDQYDKADPPAPPPP